jgi:hypothetical protein
MVFITEQNSTGTTVYQLSPVTSSGLAPVALSGSYNDLKDKPTIPAAQKNSNWTATAGVTAILNKPNFSSVATSGSYNDLINKPTIPVLPTLALVATSGKYSDLIGLPSNVSRTIKTNNYTLTLSDIDGSHIDMSANTAMTVTIPLNSKVPIKDETSIIIGQYGVGSVTIVGEAGVIIRSSGNKRIIYDQYSLVTLKKLTTDEWLLVGNLK